MGRKTKVWRPQKRFVFPGKINLGVVWKRYFNKETNLSSEKLKFSKWKLRFPSGKQTFCQNVCLKPKTPNKPADARFGNLENKGFPE